MAKRIAKLVSTNPQIISSEFSTLYNEGVVVVSQPPTRRVVEINLEYRDDDFESEEGSHATGYMGNFFLSFPLMYFRIQYSKRSSGWLHAQKLHVIFAVAKNKSKAFIPPLPNIDETMQVCIDLPYKRFSNINDLCKAVITCFWSTDFNEEMHDAYSSYDANSLLGDHRKWQDKTKSDPTWIPNGHKLVLNEYFDKEHFYGKSFRKNIQPDPYDDYY